MNGSRTPWSAVAGGAAALGLLALNYGCNFDPDAGAPQQPVSTGCKKVTGGTMKCTYILPGGAVFTVRNCQAVEVYGESATAEATGTRYRWTEKFANGTTYTGNTLIPNTAESGPRWEVCSGTCVSSTPDGPITTTPPNYTYVDATTNCSYEVEFQAWVREDDGTARPVLKISQGSPTTLASGGIIGGCNFDPILYAPGGGGGGPIVPWLPGPDGPNGEPWWWDIIKGAGGAVLGGLINRLIDKLLEEKAPATVYRLVSVCEKDAQGEPISQSREVSIPQLPILDGLVARVDAMDNLMQGLKDFKQPICEPEPPPAPVGKNISIQFRSTVPSPFGHERLRKVFRYRDPSLKELEEHRDHWKTFEWESGPWMVISEGLLWGKPQVWAKSEAEGKRVLRHAAQICGLNLDSPAHRWRVHQAVGLRERPVLKMKIHRDINGHYWIAERTGSGGLPLVAGQLSSDPGVGN